MNTLELVITLTQETGQVNVHGPIDNQMICYGMLGVARDLIMARAVQNQTRQVQLANSLPAGLVKD